jgi:hypothetical protein
MPETISDLMAALEKLEPILQRILDRLQGKGTEQPGLQLVPPPEEADDD